MKQFYQRNDKKGIPTYIDNTGVESNLEERHYAMARYANIYTKACLSDALNLAGVAQDNRQVCYCLWIAKLSKEERAKINSSFHNRPPFLNESNLQYISRIVGETGLDYDVHMDVRELSEETGEVFFSVYNE